MKDTFSINVSVEQKPRNIIGHTKYRATIEGTTGNWKNDLANAINSALCMNAVNDLDRERERRSKKAMRPRYEAHIAAREAARARAKRLAEDPAEAA